MGDTMNNNNNDRLIFKLCCLALIVTSMTFAIRAGILNQLGVEFDLTGTQLGWVNSMAFLGFPIATMLGGVIYNAIGAKKLLALAFVCHLTGILLTISADGFWALLISTFLIGFANGAVEAGCNPLIAQMYPDNKTTMLNRFHVWFPGGIVIGALASSAMTYAGFNWQWQVALILIPTILYGAIMLRALFPQFNTQQNSTKSNLKHLLSPLYIFLILCMTITAVTEFGTQQWIEQILGSSGASPMFILALITGLMALGRFFAGPIVHRFSPSGVLLGSAILSTMGIFLMTQVHGSAVYLAAAVFAIGVTYFWPTMIGCVAEYTPKTGALGMSLIGGAGMFAMSIWNPIIGQWIDNAKTQAQKQNIAPDQVDLFAGYAVLQNLLLFPVVLILVFFALHLFLLKNNCEIKLLSKSKKI